jgi:hypothetical protein
MSALTTGPRPVMGCTGRPREDQGDASHAAVPSDTTARVSAGSWAGPSPRQTEHLPERSRRWLTIIPACGGELLGYFEERTFLRRVEP